MSATLTFLKKHWFTLGLLVATPVALSWVVARNKVPGSMTVIEAQGMDMTQMKPPTGVMPVTVETVSLRSLEGGRSFPATVSALTDEDAVARVPGKLVSVLVYPGDKVSAGQLLATIEAPEYEAERQKARAMAGARASDVVTAEKSVSEQRSALSSATASLAVAKSAKTRASLEVESARLEQDKAKEELASAMADRDEKQAALTYADKELSREKELFRKGAVALDEVQASQRDRDSAFAKVQGAEAAVRSSGRSVSIAGKRVESATQTVLEAEAQIAGAQSGVKQGEAGVSVAQAGVTAKRFESSAALAEASGVSSVADYRQIRAASTGVVSERVVSPGTAVSAGQVVLRVKSVAAVRVQAEIPQALAGSLQVGSPVVVRSDAGDFEARLTSVSPTVDSQTRTFKVEALLPNLAGKLKPGMFMTLEVIAGGHQVLAVKTTAVQSEGSGKSVWTAKQNASQKVSDWTCTMHPQVSEKGPGKCPLCGMDLVPRDKTGNFVAHRVAVTAGESGSDRSEVKTGLKEGDRVIVTGFENLVEGMPVEPTEAKAETPKPPALKVGVVMPEPSRPSPVTLAKPKARGKVEPRQIPATERPAQSADVYYCPMDKVFSDKPGKCPKCGMDFVKKEAAQ